MSTHARRAGLFALIALLFSLAERSFSQTAAEPSPLSLQQAATVALEKNPLRKAALADTKVASAGVREAQSFLMPHINFSELATRGDDPVYIFGSKLRQQRFTADNFAPPLNKLNNPLPYGNFATRFGGTWNLFDSFASWHGINRAKEMNVAASHQLERTDQEILFRVVQSYYGVLLASKQLEVAEQAEKTAKSIMERSQVRFDAGLVVESDLLSAKVRLASREQELIRARNNLELARAQLNTAMGVPADAQYQMAESLADKNLPAASLPELERGALTTRPDLKRIEAQQSAQELSVAIAKSSFGPRLNAFAGWELDNPTFLAGGGGNNWLGGLELQIDLFQGGAKRAALARERANAEKIAALKQAANDAVRLEVRQAYYDQDATRQQIDVARTAINQAQESLRINQDRYDGGLLTITDLLGTEEAARRSQADYWQAVYQFHISYANLELASGTLNLQSPVVTP
ncbi:MAG TPA: TolC family protein [Candidatus Sulfotelmatobacter sp.]|nr:TolC family protein [Candidatus Sulfotelmatobacter sp.]